MKISFFLLCFCGCVLASSLYPCNYTAFDGTFFDFSPLTVHGKDYQYYLDNSFYYIKMNICGLVQTDTTNCASSSYLGNCCLYNASSDDFVAVLAREATPLPKFSQIDQLNLTKGVRLTFKNGFGFNFVFPTVVIDFTCAAKVGPMFIYTDDPRIYYAEIASPYACIRTPNKTETIEQQDFAEA